ncbi:TRAP transporter small permease [Microbacterium halophytorum]|uniref:TRAP transporter small permease n=1 Tax=Microbacterium halophytorum TaxID=2067568 RepID=UPI001319F558|nr:TRAP transporter small permease subunit [Microbacterium halophytorum]
MGRRKRDESIFGRTETVFSVPDRNAGVPEDPLPLRLLSRLEIVVGAVCFIGILVGVIYQVLGRYIPAISWIGAGELALLSMVTMTFVMIGYLVGRSGHVTIEIFDRLLEGGRLFVALRVFSSAVVLVSCAWLAFESWEKIGAEMGRASAAIGVPVGLVYVFALIGSLSGALHSVLKIRFSDRPERRLDVDGM